MQFPRSRKYPRLKINGGIPVECIDQGRTYQTMTHNLGGGGLFLDTPQPMTVDQKLVVQFSPAQDLGIVKAEAKVRYQVEGTGHGLEFTAIRPEHRAQILKMVLRDLHAGGSHSSMRFVAQVYYERGMFLGFSTRWGEDGLLVETRETLPPGSRVNVRFRVKEDEPLTVAAGEVLFSAHKLGMALKITPTEDPFARNYPNYDGSIDPF